MLLVKEVRYDYINFTVVFKTSGRGTFQGVSLIRNHGASISNSYQTIFSRQTRKDALQLLQHNSLLGRSHICLVGSVPDTNTRKTPRRPNDRSLRRKPCRATSLDIRGSTAGRAVDSGQDEAKVGRRRTGAAAYGWEIDIEPDVGWEVGFARGDEALGDVC